MVSPSLDPSEEQEIVYVDEQGNPVRLEEEVVYVDENGNVVEAQPDTENASAAQEYLNIPEENGMTDEDIEAAVKEDALAKTED